MKLRLGFVSNSSSSCFICRSKLPLNKVKAKLELIKKHWLEITECNEEIAFGDYFIEPYIGTRETFNCVRQFEEYLNEQDVVGKIIIESSSDNSIPYELFTIIESIFDARRVHCG